MRFPSLISFTLLTILAATAAAQDPLATIIRPTEPLTPQEQLAKFHLPDDFEIQLFAAEPDIQKPMNMAFDARGRLWVTGSVEYPFAAEPGKGRDTIRVLQDTNTDGRADRISTFVDGLNIPMGLYPYRDGVVAYSIPNIYFFHDEDGDGRCDHREVLYGPLGEPVDTHGMQNSFRRGFDGWLYACHGFRNESTIRGRDGSEIKLSSGNTYRVRLDGSRVEQFTWGQVNPFGSTFTPAGDLISADCHSKPLTLLLRGGYYSSFGKPHDGLGFVPPILEHTHGSTAIAGAAYYDGDAFSEPYRGSLFVGNVMTSRVHRDRIVMRGSTMKAHEVEDFLTCDDPWFRPVDLQIGPDGALYIADFYNRIIGHYEVALDHPARDRTRGRIWRVVYEGDGATPQGSGVDLSEASTKQLIAAIGSSSFAMRALATDQLSDRVVTAGSKELREAAGRSNSRARIHSLWVLHRLGKLTVDEIAEATRATEPLVRIHAMRLLSESRLWSEDHRELTLAGLSDSSPLVRRSAADALGQHPDKQTILPLLTALEAAPTEDSHLRHSMLIALRNQLQQPDAVSTLQDSNLTSDQQLVLCRVALAVSSAEAADFLIAMMSEGVFDEEQLLPQLKHAAAHVSEEVLADFVELARQQAGEDLDLQLELIQILQQQFTQRGMRRTPSVESWGSELAEELLASIDDASASWGSSTPQTPWGLEPRNCEDGQDGVIFLSSLAGGEQATGVLRSRAFKLPDELSFFLCGHLGFPKDTAVERNLVRLRLVEDDKIVRKELPPRHDLAKQVVWDLREFNGQRGYIEIVDRINLPAYAWLGVSRFEPAVVALPKLAPRVVAARQTASALIAKTLRLQDLRSRLSELLRSETTNWQVRAATVEALLEFNSHPLGAALLVLLRDESVAFQLRDAVVRGLTKRNKAEIVKLVETAMRSVPTRLQLQVASALATNRVGAELLLELVKEGHTTPQLLQLESLRRALATTGLKDVEERIEELTATLPPLNLQIARQIQERRNGFLRSKPSALQGKTLFEKHCAACHQVANKGSLVGPQLDGIGNRGLERILEDVFDPNRNIDAAFHVTVLATNEGRVLTGQFRRQQGQAKLFAGKDGKEFSVLIADIDEERKSRISIMPDNWAALLKDAECYDLLAYLVSLRK
jgi:putative heme-binding domain-containing protein